MKRIFAFAVLLVAVGCNRATPTVLGISPVTLDEKIDKPVRWEKGWKTSRVTAEYWPKAAVGYSLKFTFPKNEGDSDSSTVFDTFEDFDCNVYEGGGAPGAPAYASCDSVRDTASADTKLQELLPPLTQVLANLSENLGRPLKSKKTLAREAAEPKTMAEWIARENSKKKPCSTDGWRGSGSDGYASWSEFCKHGVVVYADTTAESQEWEAKENAHNDSLANALVSRCLDAKEMAEVTNLGYYMYVRPMQPYNEREMQDKFNAALLTQQLLQIHCPKADTQGGTPQER